MQTNRFGTGLVILMLALGMAGGFTMQGKLGSGAGFLPRGTELPELGDEHARHYSNGDGTIRAVIEAGPGHAELDDLVSLSTSYVGSSELGPIVWTRHHGALYVGHVNIMGWIGDESGYAEWDISTIPNSATVNSLVCSTYVLPSPSGFPVPPSIPLYEMTLQPSNMGYTYQQLYDDAKDGNSYGTYSPIPTNAWLSVALSSSARSDLENHLQSGNDDTTWFAVGYSDEDCPYGSNSEIVAYQATNPPRLVVDYTPPASPPGVFSLVSPPDHQAGVPVAGDLVWNTSVDADSYEVFLGEAYPPVSVGYVLDTTYAYSGLNNSALYHWYVVARNDAGTTVSDDTFDFTTVGLPPAAFDLVSPPDHQAGVPVAGDLVWNTSVDADSYEVFLGEAYPPVSVGYVIDTTYAYSGLNNDTLHHWYVVARNDVGPTVSNDTFDFTTIGLPPAAFDLVDPPDHQTGVPVGGDLIWNTSVDADSYEVFLDETYPPVSVGYVSDTTYAYSGLNNSTLHHWYVIACNGVGTTVSNDTFDFTTASAGSPDMGIVSIDVPVGAIDTGEVVTPQVTVRNCGDVEMAFDVFFTISDTATDYEIYNETTAVVGVSTGSDSAITFPNWTAPTLEGPYATWAELIITDLNAANDTLSGSFGIGDCPNWPPGWVEMEKVPSLPGGKAVKRGAWATYNAGDELIYATKGYKTTDFYAYYPLEDSWDNLTGMPYTKHSNPKWARKVPRKGSKGVADDDNYIYVTQGNNTLGFWRYGIAQDSWEELKDVPVGPDRKKVKGGTDLAYLVVDDSSYVYCLKGYRCEFYRYNTATGLWSTALAPAPKGTRGKWDKGSWLVAENDAATTLYAHKAKYNELWSYDVAEDSWNAKLTGIPFVGLQGRKKKSKDGGSADWFDGEIYALKGGNTNEFWKYTPASDSWLEIDSMPTMGTTGKKKRVKYGADIVNYAGCPAFFTLKGNKTFEWWRYGVAEASRLTLHASRRTVQASSLERTASSVLHIAPNPLTGGYATVRYSLPKAGPATLTVVDVAGRTVSSRTVLASRSGAVSLDLRSLSAGVYLVRLEADGFEITGKLIVQH